MYKQCKTKQSIERQRRIALKLMKLMEKQPYVKISVSGLCRECYISRNVFYKYFDDIDSVFDFVADELVSDLSRYSGEGRTGKKQLLAEEWERFFQYWYEQRNTLDLIIENNLMGILFTRIVENACRHHIGIGRMPEEMPREYYPMAVNVSLYGVASLLIKWHDEKYRTAPGKMAEASLYLLTHPLFTSEKR